MSNHDIDQITVQFRNHDIDQITVQLRKLLNLQGQEADGNFESDEDKYITASEKSESDNPQDTENIKNPADAELSPENSYADLNSGGPGIRSNDDFRRVFKSVRFAKQESQNSYLTRPVLRAKRTISGSSPIINNETEDLPSPNDLKRHRRIAQAYTSKGNSENQKHKSRSRSHQRCKIEHNGDLRPVARFY